MVRKIALTLLCCSLVSGGIYLGLARGDRATQALRAYRRGRLDRAEQLLEKAGLSRQRLCLLEGYLSRARGNLDQSNQVFEQGLALLSDKPQSAQDQAIAHELACNVLFNAYLQRNWQALNAHLQHSRHLEPPAKVLALFDAISAQQERDHDRALSLFSSALPLKFTSPWMAVAFSKVFSYIWVETFQARSCLALGETVRTRQLLKDVAPKAATRAESDERAMLVALSYLQEGQAQPKDLAAAYYKLCDAYLQSDEQRDESSGALNEILRACQQCIQRGDIEICAALIERLEAWNATQGLTQLAKSLVEQMGDFAKPPQAAALAAIRALPAKFRGNIDDAISQVFESALRGTAPADLEAYYRNALPYTADPVAFVTQLCAKVDSDLERRLQSLNASSFSTLELALIETRLHFIKMFSPSNLQNAQTQAKLAVEISACIARGDESDAGRLQQWLAMLLQAPKSQRSIIGEAIEGFIARDFASALAVANFERMMRLCDIANALDLDAIPPFSRATVSSVLGDAEYCLKAGQTDQALRRLRWIAKLVPDYPDATRELVRALCQKLLFNEALALIERYPKLDLCEFQITCYIQLNRIENALTTAQRPNRRISPLTLQLLGERADKAGYSEGALAILQRIPKPDERTWGLIAKAAFHAHHFETCWQAFQRAQGSSPPPLDLTTRALASLIELHRERESSALAEEMLTRLSTTEEEGLPPDLEDFGLQPHALLARYYRQERQNWHVAMQCLDLHPGKSFSVALERARVFLDSERADRALITLAAEKLATNASERQKLRALRCRALIAHGEEVLGLTELRDLMREGFLPSSAQVDCVLALMQLQQWQNAWNVLQTVPFDLGWPMPKVLYQIAILGELGRYEEGAQLAKSVRHSASFPQGPTEQFAWAINARKSLSASDETTPILSSLNTEMSTPLRAASIAQYYLDVGDFENAERIRDNGQLGLTRLGRDALASLAYHSGDRAGSLEQWRRQVRDPGLTNLQFSKALSELVTLGETEENLDKLRLSLAPVAEARASERRLFRESCAWIARARAWGTPEPHSDGEAIAERLLTICTNAPTLTWPQVHLGQLRLSLGDLLGAKAAFATALECDPTCAVAHFGLSCVDLDLLSRIDHLERACKAAPECAEYWSALAHANVDSYRSTRKATTASASKAQFSRANLLDPQLLETYWGMAELLALEGESASARKLLQAGLAKVPENQRAARERAFSPQLSQLLGVPSAVLLAPSR